MSTVRVTVRVKPGASRANVGGSYGHPAALIVSVHAQPVDGQANSAVIDALAAAFNIRRSAITVVAGNTGRTKIIELSTENPQLVNARLNELLNTPESI